VEIKEKVRESEVIDNKDDKQEQKKEFKIEIVKVGKLEEKTAQPCKISCECVV